ncbi:MAG TPA: hypothetical protein VFV34_29140 [Blastocatellia bacterium]|nr:hypothetical protein [Blastocatellia bacterium]
MRPKLPEIAGLVILLVITGYQLFIPHVIGVSDNGDFARLFHPAGLEQIPTDHSDKYFDYFNVKYRIVARPLEPAQYESSAIFFVRAARWLNIRLLDKGVFDIRVLGAVYLSCFLFGSYLVLVSMRQLKPWCRVTASAVFLFFYSDPPYVAMFNSFYAEAAALVCVVVIAGCSLILISRQSRSWAAMAGYFVACAVLVTAKPMYVPAAVAFAAFGVYLSRYLIVKGRYWLSGALACGLLAVATWYFEQTPEWLKFNVRYIGVFTTTLLYSPTPGKDLEEMELNPEWARYSGSTPYQPDSPALTDPAFRAEFLHRVRPLTVTRFLLTHPARFYKAASNAAGMILTTRPRYAGYYEKVTGKPPLTQPVAIWSSVRASIFPASVWLLIAFFGTGAGAAVLAFWRRLPDPWTGLLALYSMFAAFAATIFFVPVLTMGAIDPRYSVSFTSAFDIDLIIILVGAVYSRAIYRQLVSSRDPVKSAGEAAVTI